MNEPQRDSLSPREEVDPPPDLHTELASRLREQIAATSRRREAERDLRRQLAERRDHGLAQRHAQKLGRSQGHRVTDGQPVAGPTTAEPDIHIPGPTAPPAEKGRIRPLAGPIQAHRADYPANAAGGHPQTGVDQREDERAEVSVPVRHPSESQVETVTPTGSEVDIHIPQAVSPEARTGRAPCPATGTTPGSGHHIPAQLTEEN